MAETAFQRSIGAWVTGLLNEPGESAKVRAAEVRAAKATLQGFVRAAWKLVEPGTDLAWNWHIDVLCDTLMAVSRGEISNLVINVPPGTSKSLLTSVFWPAWEWANNPGLRFLTASYSGHLTIRDNLRLRDIVTSEWYQSAFPDLRLSGDQNSKIRFDTTAQGWRIATSVGGAGTGEHPDRIIVDDPLTASQARSSAERKSANHWMDRTISSRGIVRDVRKVVIMQRLHEDDLSGHLMAKGGWEHLCLPMHYRPEQRNEQGEVIYRPDPRDRRRVAGELLWPALYTPEKVRSLELALGPYGAAGQLEQEPAPEGGGLFKRSWFGPPVAAAPVDARRMRGWDTAGKEDEGDWTVGVRMAEKDDIIYIESVVRGQLGPAGVDDLILQTTMNDTKKCGQREEKEGGSAGIAVISARAKTLKGYDYKGVSVTGDKVTRAKPFRAQCEAGNVKVVSGEWNEVYYQELESFPTGKHDDQVDASSAAYNALVAEAPPKKRRLAW